MFSKPLDKNECAFFVFNREQRISFWNKNVSYAIDVIFINKDKIITAIKHLEAEQEENVSGTAKFVLETKKNFCKDRNIKVGNYIKLPSTTELRIFEEN